MGMKIGVTGHWEGGLISDSESTDPVQWSHFSMGMSLSVNEAKGTKFRRLNYWSLGMRVLFHRNDAIGLME